MFLIALLTLAPHVIATNCLTIVAPHGRMFDFSTLRVSDKGKVDLRPLKGISIAEGERVSDISSSSNGIAVLTRPKRNGPTSTLQVYSTNGNIRLIKRLVSEDDIEFAWRSNSSLVILLKGIKTNRTTTSAGGIEFVTDSFTDFDQAAANFQGYSQRVQICLDTIRRKNIDGYISNSVLEFGSLWLWPPDRGSVANINRRANTFVVNRSVEYRNVATVFSGKNFEDAWDLPITFGRPMVFFGSHYLAVLTLNQSTHEQEAMVFDLRSKTLIVTIACSAIG